MGLTLARIINELDIPCFDPANASVLVIETFNPTLVKLNVQLLETAYRNARRSLLNARDNSMPHPIVRLSCQGKYDGKYVVMADIKRNDEKSRLVYKRRYNGARILVNDYSGSVDHVEIALGMIHAALVKYGIPEVSVKDGRISCGFSCNIHGLKDAFHVEYSVGESALATRIITIVNTVLK